MVDVEYLRKHYGRLNDEELGRLSRTDLVPEARTVLVAEMSARGLVPDSPPDIPEPGEHTSRGPAATFRSFNPYAPPTTVVGDPNAAATLAVSGLVRLFQTMVIASPLIGLFLFFSPMLPLPTSEPLRELRNAAGADAIAYNAAFVILWVLQPLWILSGIGLFFFKWWGRPLFVGTYTLSGVQYVIGGMVIWYPWEATLVAIATLLDGAVFLLAFLPPLSNYFKHDRAK